LVADPGDLRNRITKALVEAGLEVETSERARCGNGSRPGAVVAAISGPSTRVAPGVKRLRKRDRSAPLVVVIGEGRSEQECRAAISAGADGAVMEPDIETALTPTLSATAGRQLAFPASLLQAPSQPSFTRREKQALGMMVLGFTNQEIGATLGLAESTVKSHLSSAFTKLGVSSRAEAAALILDTANGIGLDALEIAPDDGGSRTQVRSPRIRHSAIR
jgi:DNA-binding NarL/FixJ family response regulator